MPDYLNDLNAMHEAEEDSDASKRDMRGTMKHTVMRAFDRRLYAESRKLPVLHATASQRAEAFLRTIGKWEESK